MAFGFKLDIVVQCIKFRIHTPHIYFVCRHCYSKSLSNFNSLNWIILNKTILYYSEIIQGPAVVRVANIKVYESLEIYDKIHDREFILKFGEVLLVLTFNSIFILVFLLFVKVGLNPVVLILHLFKIKFVCLFEHIVWASFLENVVSPSSLDCYSGFF